MTASGGRRTHRRRTPTRGSLRRRGEERGAVALLTALLMSLVLLVMGAFVVDLGSQRVVRRDMQGLADLVALDMSRLLDGTTPATTLTTSAAWSSALSRSVARNAGTYGDPPTVAATAGTLAPSGDFTPLTTAVVPNAVRVTASSSVRFVFGLASSGGASRSSIATTSSTACFTMGSYAARLNAGSSPLFTTLLNGALGSTSLTAASYQGLVGAKVGLAALATQLGVGTVDHLATTSVTLKTLYLAAAQVLSSNGDVTRANLLTAIAVSLTNNGTVGLGSILSIASGGGAAATATVQALDLVAGTAFVANGSNLLSVPTLGTGLGLTGTGLSSTLALVQGLQEVCGRIGAAGSTSQSDVVVSGRLASIATPASLAGLTLTAGGTAVEVHVARAVGTLTAVVCGTGTTTSPQGMDVAVNATLAQVSRLSQTLTIGGSVTNAGLLGGLVGGLLGTIAAVQVTGSLTLTAQSTPVAGSGTAAVRYPVSPTSWDTPVSTGAGSLTLGTTLTPVSTSGLTITATNVLGLNVALTAAQTASITTNLVNGLTGPSGPFAPMLAAVNSSILSPVSALLGVSLGGADVYGVPTPSCNTPALAG